MWGEPSLTAEHNELGWLPEHEGRLGTHRGSCWCLCIPCYWLFFLVMTPNAKILKHCKKYSCCSISAVRYLGSGFFFNWKVLFLYFNILFLLCLITVSNNLHLQCEHSILQHLKIVLYSIIFSFFFFIVLWFCHQKLHSYNYKRIN